MKKFIAVLFIAGGLLVNMSFAEFSDVVNTHWAYSAIEKMQNDGILTGYVDGTFKPNKNINLAEFSSIFTKIFELPKDDESNYFQEIPKSHWAKGSIEAIRKYINPYYDSVGESLGFDYYSYMEGITADLEMTREAFVYAVSKIYGYDESDYVSGEEKELFADYDEILFPKEMVLAYKNGVISGEVEGSSTYIRPNRHITRAEASAIFRNLLKYDDKRIKNKEQDGELVNAMKTFITNLKEFKFDEIKNSIYDTSGTLNNEYFIISKENMKMLEEVLEKYFKKFEYEIIKTEFKGFNNGYVVVKIKGYDIKNELNNIFEKVYTGFEVEDTLVAMSEFLADFSNSINDKSVIIDESEEIFNFIKQDGEWKLSL